MKSDSSSCNTTLIHCQALLITIPAIMVPLLPMALLLQMVQQTQMAQQARMGLQAQIVLVAVLIYQDSNSKLRRLNRRLLNKKHLRHLYLMQNQLLKKRKAF